ncbi:hypothetical protein SGI37_20420, partial [Providencia rettgeri]
PVFELAGSGDAELVELSVNYRTPSEVMAFAAEEVARLGGTVSAPASVRSTGVLPEVRSGSIADLDELMTAAREAVGDTGIVVAVVPE